MSAQPQRQPRNRRRGPKPSQDSADSPNHQQQQSSSTATSLRQGRQHSRPSDRKPGARSGDRSSRANASGSNHQSSPSRNSTRNTATSHNNSSSSSMLNSQNTPLLPPPGLPAASTSGALNLMAPPPGLPPASAPSSAAVHVQSDHGTLDESDQHLCALCFDPIRLLAVGSCGHEFCHKCSLRLRVLCNDKKCPSCRKDLPKVLLTSDRSADYNSTSKRGLPYESSWAAYCSDSHVQQECKAVFRATCPKCNYEAKHMKDLMSHVKRTHEMHYCEICVDNTHLFPWEHVLYTRKQVVQHRKSGCKEQDPSSFHGHPSCSFCDKRFYDKDALKDHLDKQHERCYFCKHKDVYFVDYGGLEEHFREQHFLCEDPMCLRKKFVAFATKMELQAHMAKEHFGTSSRSASKAMRQVDAAELLFTHETAHSRRQRQQQERDRRRGRDASAAEYDLVMDTTTTGPSLPSEQDFPALGLGASSAPPASSAGRATQWNPPAAGSRVREEDFPELAPAKSSSGLAATAGIERWARVTKSKPAKGKRGTGPAHRGTAAPPSSSSQDWPSLSGPATNGGSSALQPSWGRQQQSSAQQFPDQPAVVANLNFQFRPPPDFKSRSKEFFRRVKRMLGDEGFQEFKEQSSEFRQGAMAPDRYVALCRSLFQEQFASAFQELVAFLPDLDLQSQLVDAYDASLAQHKVKSLNLSGSGVTVTRVANKQQTTPIDWIRCPICYQVLLAHDIDHHIETHEHDATLAMDSEFPALGPGRPAQASSTSRGTSSRGVQSAWGR